jgi:hypothetical protein
MPDLWEWILI